MFNFFNKQFSAKIYLKSGAVIEFPKGYFTKLEAVHDGSGALTELRWMAVAGNAKLLLLKLEAVDAVVTFR